MIKVKRVYEKPSKSDGQRILVDRLWPRGVSKEDAKIDLWVKELTPSNELRDWYHENKEGRFEKFSQRYKKELRDLVDKEVLEKFSKNFTLITSVKDIKRSHIPTLKKFLRKKFLVS